MRSLMLPAAALNADGTQGPFEVDGFTYSGGAFHFTTPGTYTATYSIDPGNAAKVSGTVTISVGDAPTSAPSPTNGPTASPTAAPSAGTTAAPNHPGTRPIVGLPKTGR